jgi:hypothetical protein
VSRQFNAAVTELFWQQRIESKFKGLERFRKLFNSWKEFYMNSLGATYLVRSNDMRFYRDIRDAYQEFVHVITFGEDASKVPSLEKIHLLPKYKGVISNPCQLYILFSDREIAMENSDHLLLSVSVIVDGLPVWNDYLGSGKPNSQLQFFVSEELAKMPVLDQGIFSLHEREGFVSVKKNRRLSRMLDRPNEVVDDEDFITVSEHYLAEILGDGFEIDEDQGTTELNVLIKGGITHERFKKYFKSNHRKEDAEDYADEDYLPYTLEYNEAGLRMMMDIYDFICTTPVAFEINQILLRSRNIPDFFDY